MSKFKHGDRVTCTICETKITDARISIDKDGTPFICQNQLDGSSAEDKLGYKYSWSIHKNFKHYEVSDLKLAGPKTLDDIEVGDILVRDGEEFTVIFRSGQLVVFSHKIYFFGNSASDNFIIEELKNRNFKLKEDKPVETITISGHTYNKEEVENVLKELKEVKQNYEQQ